VEAHGGGVSPHPSRKRDYRQLTCQCYKSTDHIQKFCPHKLKEERATHDEQP
jgi:hypothetical protein